MNDVIIKFTIVVEKRLPCHQNFIGAAPPGNCLRQGLLVQPASWSPFAKMLCLFYHLTHQNDRTDIGVKKVAKSKKDTISFNFIINLFN